MCLQIFLDFAFLFYKDASMKYTCLDFDIVYILYYRNNG